MCPSISIAASYYIDYHTASGTTQTPYGGPLSSAVYVRHLNNNLMGCNIQNSPNDKQ